MNVTKWNEWKKKDLNNFPKGLVTTTRDEYESEIKDIGTRSKIER